MGEFVSKWGASIQDKDRCKLLRSSVLNIQKAARDKGFTASYFEMARIIRAQGVNISDSYIHAQMTGVNNRYPFPFEVLYLLCKGYSIPLEVVFSEQVTKGLK